MLNIFSSADTLKKEVSSTRTKLEDAKRRREDLLTTPLTKADVVELLLADVERRAHRYEVTLRAAIEPLIRAPLLPLDEAHKKILGGIFTPVRRGGQMVTLDGFADVIAVFFGPEERKRLAGMVAAMDWPENAGPPRKERAAALAKVEAEIQELEALMAKFEDEKREIVRAFQ